MKLSHVARRVGMAVAVLVFGLATPVSAQWMTQTNALVAGWNAVYLHVDATHVTVDEIIGSDPANSIVEIWHWQPDLPTGQFVDSPQVPSGTGSRWVAWTRAQGISSPLRRLPGNGAYLVRLPSGAAPYAWRVKGKPVAPTYRWTLTGLNFLGFPTRPNPSPTFESFVAPAPELAQRGEFYRYQGGDLGATNPILVVSKRTTPVLREQAYWVRAGESYNQYFGPIQIVQSSASGIRFGESKGQAQFRLRNLANAPVTVSLTQVASEPAPAGQPFFVGQPPLLIRGAINTTNLTYGYTNLAAGPRQWSLAAAGQVGSEVEVVLGLNRSQMTAVPGAFYAGVLRFTDSLGLSQIDMEVSAVKESTAGLWVGGATVSYVSHYLKPYAKVASTAEFEALLTRLQLGQGVNGYRYEWDPSTGRVLVFGGPENKTGSYLVDGPIKVDSGTVAQPFPLRLIVHSDGTATRLLQKVYHGLSPGTNTILATRESLLHPKQLASARRISAVHLPTSSANLPWTFNGNLRLGTSLSVDVPTGYQDQASNPFLHTYHPDHDNLDALFAGELERGAESYGVTRRITLTLRAPADDFDSLTGSSGDVTGDYAEAVTFDGRGANTRVFNALGTFTLKRISDIATLTIQ